MTTYRPLDPTRDWNFFHPKVSIPETSRSLIRPLTGPSARELWRTCVSTAGNHTMLLPAQEWPQQLFRSCTRIHWRDDWNTGSAERIAEVLRQHLAWPEDTPAYFFWSDNHAVEAPWTVFVRHWPAFLFRDEGPILLSPRQRHAVVFSPNGHLYIGTRPETWVRERRQVVVFDLDGTLGVPVTDGQSIVRFRMRRGCGQLVMDLRRYYSLVLWSVSSRMHVENALDHGLRGFFEKTYSRDEHPCQWKDVRSLPVDWLVDASHQHRQEAIRCGIASDRYIVVPACGSPADDANPLAWADLVRTTLLLPGAQDGTEHD